MAVHLRVFSPSGALLGLLPYPADLKTQAEHNGAGALTFTYPRNALGAALLAGDDPRISLVIDGVEQPQRYLLEDDGDDPADGGGDARPVQVGCRGALALLDRAVIYPVGHTPGQAVQGLDAHFPFVNATPGAVIATLLQRAQARGALPEITWDFTSAADSAGRPWPTTYTVQYDAGGDLLKTVTSITGAGWADVRMEGYRLRAYVPDTACATDHPGIVLYLGRDVLKGPRQRSRRSVRSHLLASGDSGNLAEVVNPTAAARYGRREAFDGRGGITDTTTLAELARVTLGGMGAASEGFTIELDPAATQHRPGIDYRPGDYIRYDQRRTDPTTLEPLRVRTIATTYDDAGLPTSSLELNDLFVEQRIRVQRQLDALTNGSATASRTPLPPLGDRNDTVAPKQPDAVLLGSWAYLDRDGQQHAALAVSWPKVTQNADGTVYDDAGNYYVSYLLPGLATGGRDPQWSPEQAVNGTITHYDQLPAGQRVQARVRTVDASGNSSTWRLSEEIILASDTTPPPVPSKPTVTSLIGALRAVWDGRGAQGEEMPADFAELEVHASTAAGFTPSAATIVDRLAGAAAAPITGLSYGTTYYVRFVARDRAGNASRPSVEASAAPTVVIRSDLADQIIGTLQLADATIVGAKIALATIQDANIGTVSASKLTVGKLNADLTVSARIKTADTGARVEINSGGIEAWNAAGVRTVSVSATTGEVKLIGGLSSGTTGQRIEINPGGGLPEIRFFPTNGNNYAFINAVGGSNGSAYIGLNSGTFQHNGQSTAYRLYLTDYVSALETIRTDTQKPWGGAVRMTASEGAALVYLEEDKLHGYVSARQWGANLGRYNDDGSSSELWLDNPALQYRGTFPNYWYADPDRGLFTGTVQMDNWNRASLSYGPTMISDMVPIASFRWTQAILGWHVTDSSRTGFTVGVNANNSGSVGFWCFRI
ncbi:hypothetical protein [Kitasatospora sp. NBC_01300]|uniref:hypothetical protein n=1 Tax=Kitasatospora sp. NBC_01300 TaxID=2903574 RepID=UPI00352D41DD|nr:hypothetical protein OG556_16270 [Kitasatospora sp. NBC_01300]